MKQKTSHNVPFHKLTPIIVEDSLDVYRDALNFVYSDSAIRNIAITGSHGAGKSSVWLTYRNYKEKKNDWTSLDTITVSLGCFNRTEDFDEDNNKNISGRVSQDKNSPNSADSIPLHSRNITTQTNNEDKVQSNARDRRIDTIIETSERGRLEKQILSQILYQIDEKKIPKSKIEKKENTSKKQIYFNTLTLIAFIITFVLIFLVIPALVIPSQKEHCSELRSQAFRELRANHSEDRELSIPTSGSQGFRAKGACKGLQN